MVISLNEKKTNTMVFWKEWHRVPYICLWVHSSWHPAGLIWHTFLLTGKTTMQEQPLRQLKKCCGRNQWVIWAHSMV